MTNGQLGRTLTLTCSLHGEQGLIALPVGAGLVLVCGCRWRITAAGLVPYDITPTETIAGIVNVVNYHIDPARLR